MADQMTDCCYTGWVPAATATVKVQRRTAGNCDQLMVGLYGALTWCPLPLEHAEGHVQPVAWKRPED